MSRITSLKHFSDGRGNTVEITGVSGEEATVALASSINIHFRGSNNRLVVHAAARLTRLVGTFDGDHGVMRIGPHPAGGTGDWAIRVGESSKILIGSDVTCNRTCTVTALEGTELTIGDDCMIAGDCIVRTDDAHAIYDVTTGDRVNPSESITIGDHVWLAYGATVMPGSSVGSGSVVGTKSLVSGRFPNNCIIGGVPARVLREDIAWERPHLSLTSPAFRPNASVITKTEQYWSKTISE